MFSASRLIFVVSLAIVQFMALADSANPTPGPKKISLKPYVWTRDMGEKIQVV